MKDYYQGEELLKELRNLRNAILTLGTLWLAEQPSVESPNFVKQLAKAQFRVAVLYEMFEKSFPTGGTAKETPDAKSPTA